MQTMRRVLVGLLAGLMFITPHKRAEAFVAPLAVPYLLTSSGVQLFTASAIAGLVAGGVAILGMKFKDSGSADVYEVQLNPKMPQRVPSGWTAPSLPGDPPVPPSTTSQITKYQVGYSCVGATLYDTPLLAAQAAAGCPSVPYTPFGELCGPFGGGTYSFRGQFQGSPGSCPQAITNVAACPAGYTVSGGSCNLTSAPSVVYPADGVGRKKITSGAFADDSRDPDTSYPANVTAGSSTITVKSGSSTTTITINGDGTITAKATTPNGDGTSTVTTLKTSAPSGATDGGTNAQAFSVGTSTGEGSTAEQTPATATDCGGQPCARESTQVANKALLQEIVTTGVKVIETGTPSGSTAFDAATTSVGSHKSTLEAAIDAHKAPALPWAWGFTFPSLSCATWSPSFVVGGVSRTMTVDWCPYFTIVRTMWAWFISIFTALYVWRSFASALGR